MRNTPCFAATLALFASCQIGQSRVVGSSTPDGGAIAGDAGGGEPTSDAGQHSNDAGSPRDAGASEDAGGATPDLATPDPFYVYECLGEGVETGFEFRWKDNAIGEDGYVLERAPENGSFVVRATLGANAEATSDGIEVDSTYSYRVRAKRGDSFSAPSEVLRFTSLWQPIYFALETTNPRSATLEFFDRSVKETGYLIERSEDDGRTYQLIAKQPTAAWMVIANDHGSADKTKVFVDDDEGRGLKPGVTYRYRVAAYNSIGQSPYARPGYLAIAPAKPPFAPGILAQLTQESSNGKTPTSVKVTLVDNANNELRTEVERSADGVTWTAIGSISSKAGEPIVSDRRGDLAPNTTYRYRARAVNDSGASEWTVSDPVIVPATPPDGATAWYVWSGATGPRSGDSWSNAWRNIDEINWVAVKPGHTLYIHGARYDKEFAIYASGSEGSPVLIRPGSASPQPTGHADRVVVPNIYFAPGVRWVTVDGSFQPTLVPATALDSHLNINMAAVGAPRHGVYSSSPVGLTVRFIEVANTAEAGIALSGLPSDKLEVYGCHVHHVGTVGVSFGYPSMRPVFDAFVLDKTLIEYTVDDAIQSGGNTTIRNNVIRYSVLKPGGHADGIQSVGGSYFRIHNNVIYDRTKSSYVFTTGSARSAPAGHWHFYNNLVYYSDGAQIAATSGILFSGQADYEPGGAFIPEAVFTDIVIANNSFVNFGGNRVVTFTIRTGVGKIRVADMKLVNNLFVDTGGIALKGDAASNVTYDEGNLLVDHNVVAGSGDILWKGAYYSAEQFNAVFGATHNSSTVPAWVNRPMQNYRLADSDVAGRNKGQSLDSLFSDDLDGEARPAGAAWDIGAYEQ